MWYQRLDAATVRITYWLNDSFVGTRVVPAMPYEDDLAYFHGSSGDGTVWIDDIRVEYTQPCTGIEELAAVGAPYLELLPNRPNPFNPWTTIEFSLPEPSAVNLSIYSASGSCVASLVDDTMPAGRSSVAWDGTDDRGRSVASGIYFYRLEAAGHVATRKMVLAR
jgi:hypothetical protein